MTDRTRARHRLAKLLLRRGSACDGRNWTLRHRRWLLTLRFEHPAAQATFDDYLRALEGVEERLRTLEQELAACAASDDYREAVGLLRCFRGVDTVTALTVLAELGDVTRFGSARQLMSYLGLTPSEFSSGARQRRGPITKTGNSHVRRILVESAWHYRHPPRVGAALRKRREGQPGWAVALARPRAGPAPPPVAANVAVARELAVRRRPGGGAALERGGAAARAVPPRCGGLGQHAARAEPRRRALGRAVDGLRWWQSGLAQTTFEFRGEVSEEQQAPLREEVAVIVTFFAEGYGIEPPQFSVLCDPGLDIFGGAYLRQLLISSRSLEYSSRRVVLAVTADIFIPDDHPLRRINPIVDSALQQLLALFDTMYSTSGRPSIPPEHLLKASLLIALYSIRSERQFRERLRYDLLFKWFLDLNISDEPFDPPSSPHPPPQREGAAAGATAEVADPRGPAAIAAAVRRRAPRSPGSGTPPRRARTRGEAPLPESARRPGEPRRRRACLCAPAVPRAPRWRAAVPRWMRPARAAS